MLWELLATTLATSGLGRKEVRGKYAKQYMRGTNIVILEKDVAAVFPTSNDVNKALRALVPIIRFHANP